MSYTPSPADNETIANLPGDIRAVTALVTDHTGATGAAHPASAISHGSKTVADELTTTASHIADTANPHATTASQVGAEPELGNPTANGMVVQSTIAGVRSWGYASPLTAILNDTKTSGTNGGTFTSGSWQTRTLNTIAVDHIGVTLSNNQFTLPAGKYLINAIAPAYFVNYHKCRLQNITDSATVELGTNGYNCYDNGHSHLITEFTITASKTFEIQHYCTLTAASYGFGEACSLGVSEIYTVVEIVKLG